MERYMRFLTVLVLIFLMSACGGSVKKDLKPSTDWVEGEYLPSKNFANICIDPRQNNDYQDLLGNYQDENSWIRSWSHETYLWYNELPDIDPASIKDPIDYFDRMKTSAKTSNGLPKDRFHYTQSTEEYEHYKKSGVSIGYGASFTISFDPTRVFINFTELNSPARRAGILRGDEVIKVNNQIISDINSQEGFDILFNAAFPSKIGDSHSFVIRQNNLEPKETFAVTLKSDAIIESPLYENSLIEINGRKIGYIVLNTFAVTTAEKKLIDMINNFKKDQIDELILDLRYNPGGFLAISAELSTMIAGLEASNHTFTQLVYNDKLSVNNQAYEFPKKALGIEKNSPYEGQALPTLNIPRVYVITTNNTASASELLINGLRGIDFEVVLIGGSTHGKPYGWVPRDNCGITYSAIQFKMANAKGFSDYNDGFVPVPPDSDNTREKVKGCVVLDDYSRNLGDRHEKMLSTAIYHIENNSCPTTLANINNMTSHPLSKMRGEVLKRFPNKGLLLQ